MMEFSICLEACDPERNIHRAYQLAAGQDLFGDWAVEVTYGRIGAKGKQYGAKVIRPTKPRRGEIDNRVSREILRS